MAGLREGRALVDAALILRKALLRDGGASPAVRAAVRQMCGLEDDGEDEEDAEVGAGIPWVADRATTLRQLSWADWMVLLK